MFVDITAPKKPLEAERIYNKCYRGGEEITPEICLAVLRSTNFATCMKRMLTCVERLPAEKQAEFKDVVLATFTNREQPEDVAVLGEKLAAALGYADELSAVKGKYVERQLFLKSGADSVVGCGFFADEYFDYSFGGVDRAVFLAQKVFIDDAKNLPEVLDFSKCDRAGIAECDLAGVKEVIYKNGGTASFTKCENLPQNLDVCECDEVVFNVCDLSGVKGIKLKAGSRFFARRCKNMFSELDVSMCRYVNLQHSDLSAVKRLRFKDKAQFEAGKVTLPEGWDGKLVFADEETAEKKKEMNFVRAVTAGKSGRD